MCVAREFKKVGMHDFWILSLSCIILGDFCREKPPFVY